MAKPREQAKSIVEEYYWAIFGKDGVLAYPASLDIQADIDLMQRNIEAGLSPQALGLKLGERLRSVRDADVTARTSPTPTLTPAEGDGTAPSPSGSLAALIDMQESRTGMKFVSPTADGRLVFRDPLSGDERIFENLNGQLVISGNQAFDGAGGGGGSALGFSQLGESRRQFDISQDLSERQFAEDIRQFGYEEAFRRDQLRQQGQQFKEDLQFQKGVATGFVDGSPTLAREQFGEDAEMNRARLAEQARQANLGAATSAFGDVTRVTPQMGQLAIDQGRFGAEILRNAPDFLARAFLQQGQDSPLPQVSQADILNSLRSNITNINDILGGFNPQVGAYQPPAAFGATPGGAPAGGDAQQMPELLAQNLGELPLNESAQFTTPAMGGGAKVVTGTNFGSPTGALSTATQTQFGEVPDFVKRAAGIPGMANGGYTGAGGFNMVITGDSDDGKPNEELNIDLPNDQGMLVIPMDDIKGAPKKKKGGKIPYAQDGGFFGFNIPKIPTLPATSQAELQSLEAANRPPAINQIMSGGLAGSPKFGFDLFTPQQIRSLTPETRDALGTTLATQFNETLENVGFAQQQRFGAKRERGRARQVAGFI